MCGISGFSFPDQDLITRMNDAIRHRGPDGEGVFVDERISLGHRRLAIIDLSEKGTQPMVYKDYLITYNGEIYNFIDLKNELSAKGHRFGSASDTEVILHAYEEWGFDCVKRFNGMWAFCLYDKMKNILFLSRDRFGIKPLYYFYDKHKLIFSSEIKAITKHNLKLEINKTALNYYFYQKYITGNHSIYKQIYALEPSHNLIFNLKTGIIENQKYFKLEEEIERMKQQPLKERLATVEKLLIDAVKKRLTADVPVGSFLSGGLDSSIISSIIAREKKDFDTFSIGFKEKSFNELHYSIIVAEFIKTRHHYQIMDPGAEMIHHIFSRLDEPFGDSSIIPTFLLSGITREKVVVSLSGDAGDEIFGGYDTYQAFQLAKLLPACLMKTGKHLINTLPASDQYSSTRLKVAKFFKDYHPNRVIRHLNWMSQTDEIQRKQLLQENYTDIEKYIETPLKSKLIDIQLNDIKNYLAADILKKVDAASMMVSLEARIPFLDYRLVPLVLSLPERYKINFLRVKYLLKKIGQNYLPSGIIHRKKQGFAIPLSKWIKESELIKSYLLDNKHYMHKLINKEFVANQYQKHLTNKGDYSRLLWLVFVFNFWYDQSGKKFL